ncbi:protein IQ-DOMAIN 3-like [Euphorbia lathyris]|uniref:protein IQ-DOMAIN 3-like n=1 Tax=Euphorbia lathyris TaxID=212925 RepID=UPI003313C083
MGYLGKWLNSLMRLQKVPSSKGYGFSSSNGLKMVVDFPSFELSNSSIMVHHNVIEAANVKRAICIQTAFRGLMARRSLRTLKAVVRIQAVFRGRKVRKQVRKQGVIKRVRAIAYTCSQQRSRSRGSPARINKSSSSSSSSWLSTPKPWENILMEEIQTDSSETTPFCRKSEDKVASFYSSKRGGSQTMGNLSYMNLTESFKAKAKIISSFRDSKVYHESMVQGALCPRIPLGRYDEIRN